MIPPLFGKQEVGIWRVKKRFPRYGVPIWSLWPNIWFLLSTVAEKNATKNILDGRTEVKQYTPSPFGERGYNKFYLLIGLFWSTSMKILLKMFITARPGLGPTKNVSLVNMNQIWKSRCNYHVQNVVCRFKLKWRPQSVVR
jgi:hypothetical protein